MFKWLIYIEMIYHSKNRMQFQPDKPSLINYLLHRECLWKYMSLLLAIVVLYFYIGNEIVFKPLVLDSINTSYVKTNLVLAACC